MKIRASKDKKTGLLLFFVAVLLAGGTAPVRGQAPCGTFTNTAPITIPAVGTDGIADPYPSNIVVAGFFGTVTKVTVKLNGVAHTFPGDIDILLVGPGGQNAIIMSDVGGSTDITGVTLTLDDLAASSLPSGGPLVTGTYKPTNFDDGAADTFPAPAPVPSGGSALSVFNGTSPNGTWSLYVVDDALVDVGSIAGGWELTLTTTDSVLANISTRGVVQTGDDVLIGGFIVTGTDPKTVLIRAIGPSLTGVANALADPVLELHGPAGFATITNDNWRDAQQAVIIATGIPPTNDFESAILATLAPGAYTAIVRGNNNTVGKALVEAYGL